MRSNTKSTCEYWCSLEADYNALACMKFDRSICIAKLILPYLIMKRV